MFAPSGAPSLDVQLADAVADLEAAIGKITTLISDERRFDISTQLLQTAQSQLRKVEGRSRAARLVMLPIIEQAGLWATEFVAPSSFANWLAATDDIMRSVANKEVRQAVHLRDDLPATRIAALNGDIGAGHVEAMIQFGPTSDLRKQALHDPVELDTRGCDEPIHQETDESDKYKADEESGSAANSRCGHSAASGEEFLLGYSDAYRLGQFRRLVQRFAHVADPEADDRGYKQAEEREYLNLSPTWGGWDIRGFLAAEHGQQLETALNALLQGNSPTSSNSVADNRSPGQKRAAALADLARLATDTGMLGGGAIEKRQLVVNVSWTEFHRLQNDDNGSCAPAKADNGTTESDELKSSFCGPERQRRIHNESPGSTGPKTGQPIITSSVLDPDLDYATFGPDNYGNSTRIPIPAAVLKRIACDCDIKRVVFGPEGQVLDVGRTYRVVPAHIRTAVIARDRHCVYPNCDQPPERCDVHHAVRHWADGGETSVDNSALLCWHHHKVVDQTGITMRAKPGVGKRVVGKPGGSGSRWRFHDRNGTEIGI